jgi:hypothetical protein
MVIFWNVFDGQPFSILWDNGYNHVGRGNRGFIVFNNDDWLSSSQVKIILYTTIILVYSYRSLIIYCFFQYCHIFPPALCLNYYSVCCCEIQPPLRPVINTILSICVRNMHHMIKDCLWKFFSLLAILHIASLSFWYLYPIHFL